MKKAYILSLCIIIATLALSAYAQENNSETLLESTISSSAEAISSDKEDGCMSGNNSNSYSDDYLLDVDMSSDMSAPAYKPLPNNLENNPDLELKLIKDYFASYEKLWGTKYDIYNNEIKLEYLAVLHYFGTVNGCEIAMMPRSFAHTLQSRISIECAGYTMVLNTHLPILVHCGSEFYELDDAYEQGILTKENIYEAGKLIEAHGWGAIG